jgi:hypothetical protein
MLPPPAVRIAALVIPVERPQLIITLPREKSCDVRLVLEFELLRLRKLCRGPDLSLRHDQAAYRQWLFQATLSPGAASELRAAIGLQFPWGALLQLFLRSTGNWCRINPSKVLGQMPVGVNSLLRNARCSGRRESPILTATGGAVFVAVVLLVVTVGVLATGSRLPNPGRNPTSWHTSKSSLMTEGGGDELAPVQTDDSRPSPPIVMIDATPYCFPPIELPLPELVGVPHAHGLRAPPHV